MFKIFLFSNFYKRFDILKNKLNIDRNLLESFSIMLEFLYINNGYFYFK